MYLIARLSIYIAAFLVPSLQGCSHEDHKYASLSQKVSVGVDMGFLINVDINTHDRVLTPTYRTKDKIEIPAFFGHTNISFKGQKRAILFAKGEVLAGDSARTFTHFFDDKGNKTIEEIQNASICILSPQEQRTAGRSGFAFLAYEMPLLTVYVEGLFGIDFSPLWNWSVLPMPPNMGYRSIVAAAFPVLYSTQKCTSGEDSLMEANVPSILLTLEAENAQYKNEAISYLATGKAADFLVLRQKFREAHSH